MKRRKTHLCYNRAMKRLLLGALALTLLSAQPTAAQEFVPDKVDIVRAVVLEITMEAEQPVEGTGVNALNQSIYNVQRLAKASSGGG